MSVPARWYPKAKRIALDFVTTADKAKGGLPSLSPRAIIVHTNGGKKRPNTPKVAVHLAPYFNGRYAQTGDRLAAHLQFMRNGKVEQYVPFDMQAFAQFKGNPIGISCEFEDDGDPSRPLTAEQVASFIAFAVWTNIPPRLMRSLDDTGIGYHQQFREWNRSGHNCPGPVRIHQLTTEIIPAIVRRRTPATHPTTEPHKGATVSLDLPILDEHDTEDGPYRFSAPVQSIQTLLNSAAGRHGVASNLSVDGKFGPATTDAVKAFQRAENLDDDGIVGAKTWSKLLGLT